MSALVPGKGRYPAHPWSNHITGGLHAEERLLYPACSQSDALPDANP